MLRTIRLLAFVVAVSLLSLGAQCDYAPNISGVPAYNIATVNVTPSLDTIFIADTISPNDRAFFNAFAIAHNGAPMGIDAFVWESSDPAVATVDIQGIVTPRSLGTTVISASAAKVGKATLVVAPATGFVQITPLVDTIQTALIVVPASDTTRLTAKAFTQTGAPLTGVAFTWETLSPTIAIVDPNGLVHAISRGSATIRVRATGAQATATVLVR